MNDDFDDDPADLCRYLVELDARDQDRRICSRAARRPYRWDRPFRIMLSGAARRPYRSDRPVCIADDQPNEHFLAAVDLAVATQELLPDDDRDVLGANLTEFAQYAPEWWRGDSPTEGWICGQILRRRGSDVRLLKTGALYLSPGEREAHRIDARSNVIYAPVTAEATNTLCGSGEATEITLARSRIKEGHSRISRQCDLILDDQKRLKRALFAGSRGWRETAVLALKRIDVKKYFTLSSPLRDLQVPIDFRPSGLEWLRSTGWAEEPKDEREHALSVLLGGVAPQSRWRDSRTGGRRILEIVDANTIAVTATLEGIRVVEQAVRLYCHGLWPASRFDVDLLGAVLGQLSVRLCAEIDAMAFQVLGG